MRRSDEKVSLIETMEAGGESNPEELLVSRGICHAAGKQSLEENLSALENRVLYLHLLGTDYKTIAKLLDKRAPRRLTMRSSGLRTRRKRYWKRNWKNKSWKIVERILTNLPNILYIINVAYHICMLPCSVGRASPW